MSSIDQKSSQLNQPATDGESPEAYTTTRPNNNGGPEGQIEHAQQNTSPIIATTTVTTKANHQVVVKADITRAAVLNQFVGTVSVQDPKSGKWLPAGANGK